MAVAFAGVVEMRARDTAGPCCEEPAMPEPTRLNGGCHCGLLRLEFLASAVPAQLVPRACDCTFCRAHGASWVSDPAGALAITEARAGALREYRQGSGAARFLLCGECGVLVAVAYRHAGGLHGAVNAGCLDARDAVAPAVAASPQALAPEDKLARWLALWIPGVSIVRADDPAAPDRQATGIDAPATQAPEPRAIAAALPELWSPRVIGEVDDAYIKVARVQGSFGWHHHAGEDELFYVLAGRLRMELRDRVVELGEGGMFIVPRGVEHNPVAERECLVMLVERKSTLHTGNVVNERTRSIEEQLRPV
jgi:mannose-6-phosphate isomerase-like protein (cupin superfamily)